MNIKKFKSVAVAIDTYKLLKKLAATDDRSAGMQITYLVKQEAKKRKLAAWEKKNIILFIQQKILVFLTELLAIECLQQQELRKILII